MSVLTMNDKLKILAYIEEHGSITQNEALSAFSCSRLASRINELRRDGHRIVTEMEEGRRKDGSKCRYARYYLEVAK